MHQPPIDNVHHRSDKTSAGGERSQDQDHHTHGLFDLPSRAHERVERRRGLHLVSLIAAIRASPAHTRDVRALGPVGGNQLVHVDYPTAAVKAFQASLVPVLKEGQKFRFVLTSGGLVPTLDKLAILYSKIGLRVSYVESPFHLFLLTHLRREISIDASYHWRERVPGRGKLSLRDLGS